MWHESDDDLDDGEWPDETDDDEDGTVACPHCGESVYEDAERCPGCEMYLSRENRPWSRPLWLVGGVVICVILALLWRQCS